VRLRCLLATLAAVVATGCSSYAPVDRAVLTTGDAVRIGLTPQESANQAANLGSFRDNLVGTIQSLNQAGLGITVASAQAAGTPLSADFRSYLEVPWDGVTTVSRREFSWTKTALAAAAAGAVAIFILEVANPSGGGGEEPPPTNQSVIRIPIGG
jgi:hypothetical protein